MSANSKTMFSSNLMSDRNEVATSNPDRHEESRVGSSSAATNEPIINISATNTMLDRV